MADEVVIEFRGDKSQFNAVRDEVKADSSKMAATPIIVGGADAKQGARTFSQAYSSAFDDLSARATKLNQSVTALAREQHASAGGPFKFFIEGASQAERQAVGVQNKLIELEKTFETAKPGTTRYLLAREELVLYEKELAAYELQLARVAKAELREGAAGAAGGAERGGGEAVGGLVTGSGRVRGLGPVFRATGLYNYGIDETTINAAVSLGRATSGVASNAEKAAAAGVIVNETEQAAFAAAKARQAVTASTTAAEIAGSNATAAAALAATQKAQMEAEAAVGAQTEAAAAAETAAAAELTTASLAFSVGVFAAIAAGAFIVYHVISDISAESERQTKEAESLNKQYKDNVKALKEQTEELRKQRGLAQEGRDVSAFETKYKNVDIELLKQRRAELEKIQEVESRGSKYDEDKHQYVDTADEAVQHKKTQDEILVLDKLIDERKRAAQAMATTFTNVQGDDAFEAQQKKAAAAAEAVKRATAEIEKNTKAQEDAYESLFQDAAKGNPFAESMVGSAKATEKLREQLKGLPDEAQAAAVAMLNASRGNQQYALSLQNAFQVIDLKSLARKFENPTADQQGQAVLDELRRNKSNTTNPDVIADYNRRLAAAAGSDDAEAKRVLDEKLAAARGARTPAEQAIADKAVTDLAKSLSPDKLDALEKAQISSAIERTATNLENQQKEALKIQERLASVLEKLEQHEADAIKAAQNGQKLDLNVSVKDDTTDKKVTKATSATEGDTAKTYNLELVGGTNY